jgi:hypothetical protein
MVNRPEERVYIVVQGARRRLARRGRARPDDSSQVGKFHVKHTQGEDQIRLDLDVEMRRARFGLCART